MRANRLILLILLLGMAMGAATDWVIGGDLAVGGDATISGDLAAPEIKTLSGPLRIMPAAPNIVMGEFEKTLVDETSTAFVQIGVATEGHNHGTIWWSIYCTDGTDMQSMQGTLTFAAVNKAGTVTCDVEEGFSLPSGDAYAKAVSAGTIDVDAVACAEVVADTINISMDVDTSLTPTTFEVEYVVHTAEDYTVTAL